MFMMKTNHSLFNQAQHRIPGGVNSPVRAFGAVGGTPIFVERAKGAYLYDVEDNRYIDYVGSWGPMVLGHAHPEITRAVGAQIENSLSYGMPTKLEIDIAEEVHKLMPSIEKVRFVNSGTEATMSAIRLARGYTSRDKIIKFEGCYHGHSDCLLVKAGSGALTFGTPSSPGVPADTTKHTLTLDYNNCEQVKAVFDEQGNSIAAVILEPIAGNMNFIPASQAFIDTLRQCCDAHGTVLILDEVMTGFRVALHGAQSLYNVQPDLTCLGKVIGGGMPVGAFGGKADIMDHLSPNGPVYQAGTLSGNPIAMKAGLAALKLIQRPQFFEELTAKVVMLTEGLQAAADRHNVPFTTNHQGGMFGLFFSTEQSLSCFQQVMACDQARFKAFFHHMLAQGIHLAASSLEAGFVSIAHTEADIAKTIEAAEGFFATCQ